MIQTKHWNSGSLIAVTFTLRILHVSYALLWTEDHNGELLSGTGARPEVNSFHIYYMH